MIWIWILKKNFKKKISKKNFKKNFQNKIFKKTWFFLDFDSLLSCFIFESPISCHKVGHILSEKAEKKQNSYPSCKVQSPLTDPPIIRGKSVKKKFKNRFSGASVKNAEKVKANSKNRKREEKPQEKRGRFEKSFSDAARKKNYTAKSLSQNSTWIETGAFPWRVGGGKFCLQSSYCAYFAPCGLPLFQLRYRSNPRTFALCSTCEKRTRKMLLTSKHHPRWHVFGPAGCRRKRKSNATKKRAVHTQPTVKNEDWPNGLLATHLTDKIHPSQYFCRTNITSKSLLRPWQSQLPWLVAFLHFNTHDKHRHSIDWPLNYLPAGILKNRQENVKLYQNKFKAPTYWQI